jgi:hypothetical protein
MTWANDTNEIKQAMSSKAKSGIVKFSFQDVKFVSGIARHQARHQDI